jgi:hypothetical protein
MDAFPICSAVRVQCLFFLYLPNLPVSGKILLPPFKNIRRLSLVKSQHLPNLTKFIRKNINIYNIKWTHWENILYGESIDMDLVL